MKTDKNKTGSTQEKRETQNIKGGASSYLKDMASMYKNGSNDYGQNEGPVRSKTITQKELKNGLGVNTTLLKAQKTFKEDEIKKGAVGDNFGK